jgi:hypothetical protein
MDDVERLPDQISVRSAEQSHDEELYSILSELIATVSRDRRQLRMLVYEFARRRLRTSLYPHFEDGNWAEIQKQLKALDIVIDKVEADCAHNTSLTFMPEPPITYRDLTNGPGSELSIPKAAITLAGSQTPLLAPAVGSEDDVFVAVARIGKQARTKLWWKFQLGVAVLGLIAFLAIGARFTFGWLGLTRPEATTSSPPAKAENSERNLASDARRDATKGLRSTIPLPTEYGAFAVTAGRLIELPQIAMRVPDPRVAISPTISTPSQAHLPTGKLEFVIFRRDLANAAPDRVSLRVVARVARVLTFDTHGKPTTSKVEDSWVIRSNSYQMRVAPVPESPEMILIRPDPADLVLPAGRYALVLKGVAYDFTLDGPTTDSAHCLERTDALNAPVYSECQRL